jgi:hypothetical protein
MPRKNTRVARRKTIRKYQAAQPAKGNRRLAPVPIETVVVPKGKCFFRSRNGKLKFTKEQADSALRQAQHGRAIRGSDKVESRYYLCEDGRAGSCGFYHLTSREQWTAPK